jgi:hypothetical protein
MSTLDGVLAGILDGTQAYTTYAVIDRDSAALDDPIWSLGVAASGNHNVAHRALASNDYIARAQAGSVTTSTGTQTVGASPVRITAMFTGTTVSGWIGSALSINAAANIQAPVCDRFFVGTNRYTGSFLQYFSGWIGDILIYTSAHDAAARARVWAYLQTLYVGLA